LVKQLPQHTANFEDGKQLVRSSGSVAANYREASEALSENDFYYRLKLCRKEASESGLWIELCDLDDNESLKSKSKDLIQETKELQKIFGSIITSRNTLMTIRIWLLSI
jgi:four helix bundle protein